MKFRVITIFPHFFASCLGEGLLGKAAEKGLAEIDVDDLRRFAAGKHRPVDDAPYGGGAGMVMKPDVWAAAIDQARRDLPGARVVLLTPQGEPFTDAAAQRLAREAALVLCCGRYEGIDERVGEHLVDEWLSIGDYVLTGGEPAALAVIDAVARKLPGVVGRAESVAADSFTAGLKHAQYTRPPEFRGWTVPAPLLSGNHAEIEAWRAAEAAARTAQRRPDLAALAAANRTRLAVREPDDWTLRALTAAVHACGLRELVVAVADASRRAALREQASEGVRVVRSLSEAARKWEGELLLHVAARPGPGQMSTAQAARRIGEAAAGATIAWGEPPLPHAVFAAPCWPENAATAGLLAWLDRVFGRPQIGT